MSLGGELRVYLFTFKCFGLLCLTQESRSGYRTHASKTDETIAFIGLVGSQCLALSALGHVVLRPEGYKLPMYGQVGNTYFVGCYVLACLMVSLIHLYFYVRRRRFLSLISLLLHHSRIDLEGTHDTEFVRIYALFASQAFLVGLLQGHAFNFSKMEWWRTALLTTFATYSFVLLGLVVALYYCLVRISASLLQMYNEDLVAAIRSEGTLSGTACCLRLRQRSRLLWVCRQRLNSDFGLVLVVIMAFLLFSAPGAPFFLITIVFELDISNVGMEYLGHAFVVTVLWDLPYLVAILMTLRTDEVGKEVSPRPLFNVIA